MTANDLQIGSVIQTPTNIITITQVGNTYIWARDNNNRNVVLLKNEIKEFIENSYWKILPSAPDILAQLREALGWGETGTLEDVTEVLIAARELLGAFKDYSGTWIDLDSVQQPIVLALDDLMERMQEPTDAPSNS